MRKAPCTPRSVPVKTAPAMEATEMRTNAIRGRIGVSSRTTTRNCVARLTLTVIVCHLPGAHRSQPADGDELTQRLLVWLLKGAIELWIKDALFFWVVRRQ